MSTNPTEKITLDALAVEKLTPQLLARIEGIEDTDRVGSADINKPVVWLRVTSSYSEFQVSGRVSTKKALTIFTAISALAYGYADDIVQQVITLAQSVARGSP